MNTTQQTKEEKKRRKLKTHRTTQTHSFLSSPSSTIRIQQNYSMHVLSQQQIQCNALCWCWCWCFTSCHELFLVCFFIFFIYLFFTLFVRFHLFSFLVDKSKIVVCANGLPLFHFVFTFDALIKNVLWLLLFRCCCRWRWWRLLLLLLRMFFFRFLLA